MKPLLLFLCLTGSSFRMFAQPPASFFVFDLKGSGYYMRDRFQIPLKIGTALSVTDELVIGANTMVRLLCNKLSLFTIRSYAAGMRMPLKNYADSCKDAGKSVTTETLSYIWNRFSTEGADPAANKNDYLQEYGADTRGCPDPVFNALPDTLSVCREDCFIRYQPVDTAEKYLFSIYADAKNGIPLYEAPLDGGRFALPYRAFRQLDTGTDYYYMVTRNGQEYCKRKLIRRLSDDAVSAIKKEIGTGREFQQLSPQEQDWVTGFFLERAHLLAEASRCYQQALKNDPGNTLDDLKTGKLQSPVVAGDPR